MKISETPAASVRAYDRIHAIDLMKHNVDYQMGEVFESAVTFGRVAPELGTPAEEAAGPQTTSASATSPDWSSRRKSARWAARSWWSARRLRRSLMAPNGKARALNEETRDILGEGVF